MIDAGAPRPEFVVVAPIGRDGDLICALLHAHGYAARRVPAIAAVAEVDGGRLLGLILTDEALAGPGLEAMRGLVEAQPAWSDLPVTLLTSGIEPQYAAVASQVRMEIRSLFLLDRPVRKEMLLSAVQMAFTARMKQLEVRDAAERQFQSDEALRNTEKLAVAGRLAATMAHEVNNPLEAMGNLLFLIENCSRVEEARSYAELASQELGRITQIVQHTLRFHRAPAKAELTDLVEIAHSAVALFRGRMHERQVVERISAHRTLAYCSSGEIRQALVNLIGNAIDAMPNGGHLHVRVVPIRLNGAHYARLTVADTGMGIRPEIRPNLFQQFFTTKGSRGTGLGLWLTRDIIHRNHGHLRFRSCIKSPSGTTFVMYLPATAPLDLAQTTHHQGREEHTAGAA
ncbi:MAG TPA: HAMP domain-containing sensor histidine kinase [Terracidiphilus sp.]